jgi:hypothetical protein
MTVWHSPTDIGQYLSRTGYSWRSRSYLGFCTAFFQSQIFGGWRFLQRRFSMVGSELLPRLQGPKNGPHGVGGRHADISRTLRAIQHPNSATLDFAPPAFSFFRSYFELYAVLFTTTPWLSRTVVHKLKQLRLHSLHYHGLQ